MASYIDVSVLMLRKEVLLVRRQLTVETPAENVGP